MQPDLTCSCPVGYTTDITNYSFCTICDINSNCKTCDPFDITKCLTCDESVTLDPVT